PFAIFFPFQQPHHHPVIIFCSIEILPRNINIRHWLLCFSNKNPKPSFISILPMNSVCFLRNTSVTTPCMRLPLFFPCLPAVGKSPLDEDARPARRSSFIFTRTVSPCKAVLKSPGRTITSTGKFSTITKPIPEREMSNTPFSVCSDTVNVSLFFFFEFFLPIVSIILLHLRITPVPC